MRWLKNLFRKLRVLKFSILPAGALAFEIYDWKQQAIPKRAIFCSVVVILGVLAILAWQASRFRHGKRVAHRHRRRQDDYR